MKDRQLIFISHANPEDNEFVLWLGTRLTNAGYEVWADILTLLGGEAAWQDIGEAIKEKAAVVVVVLSHASYKKDGVLDEVALAVEAARRLKKRQFVIPIRLDDLPFADFPEQLIRLNAIDFSPGWPDGFSQLLTALNDVEVPQSPCDFGAALAAWQKSRLVQSASTTDTPESLFSNWFQIQSLPSDISFSLFNASQDDMKLAFSGFQSPIAPYQRFAISFADAATLQEETPEISLESTSRIPLVQFLDGHLPNGLQGSRQDARKITTQLLRLAWDHFARDRGLLLCEFANGSAWFVPLNLVEGNIATFQDEKGKQRRRRLVGRSEKRKVYWHFAVSGKVNITTPQHFDLRPQVVFTEDGKTPLADKLRAARLRRSFCKNWWNDRWRDMLRAFAAFLSEGKGQFILPLGGGAKAVIDASPICFEAPLSVTNDDSVLAPEEDHVDVETEADALDDLDDALPLEAEFEDQLGDEDDKEGEPA